LTSSAIQPDSFSHRILWVFKQGVSHISLLVERKGEAAGSTPQNEAKLLTLASTRWLEEGL